MVLQEKNQKSRIPQLKSPLFPIAAKEITFVTLDSMGMSD